MRSSARNTFASVKGLRRDRLGLARFVATLVRLSKTIQRTIPSHICGSLRPNTRYAGCVIEAVSTNGSQIPNFGTHTRHT